MIIRDGHASDLRSLVDLTIEAFRPLFERHLPGLLSPGVFAHDHGTWEADYRQEVPTFLAPDDDRFVTLAEEAGRILGYVGWNVTGGDGFHAPARRLYESLGFTGWPVVDYARTL
jgi:hypothetical protein